jgi:hypothetical protein
MYRWRDKLFTETVFNSTFTMPQNVKRKTLSVSVLSFCCPVNEDVPHLRS